jgi:hypothetical protein
MKKYLLAAIPQLIGAEIPVLGTVFAYFDLDKNQELSEQELLKAFTAIDTNKSSTIGARELWRATVQIFERLCADKQYSRYYEKTD